MMDSSKIEQLKNLVSFAVRVAAEREGDIDTEDGSYATTDVNSMIHLESAVADFFDRDASKLTGLLMPECLINQKIDEIFNVAKKG